MIEQGVYTDLSSEAYHNDKNSISRSALMDFKKSPYKYWATHLNPDRPEREMKPSWGFGTAFHTLILEPHLFEKHYWVMPEKTLLKDVGRDIYDQIKQQERECSLTNKQVLSQADYQKLCAMRDALNRNARVKELIQGSIYECSYFWKDEHSGLMVKSRPDILAGNIYMDLKSIDDASPQNYQRDMAKYGYHIQAAMVKDGIKLLSDEDITACINICVEKSYPHSIGVYIIDEFAIESGHCEYKQLLLDLKEAMNTNTWNGYEVQTIGLPKWAT